MCYRKSCRFILVLLLIQGGLKASDLKLGLFYRQEIQSVVFSVVDGEYILSGDNNQVAVMRRGTIFYVGLTGQKLTVRDTLKSYGSFQKLDFKGVSSGNIFQVRPVIPSLPARESDDNIMLSVQDNSIEIINILDLEKYISGCVEAEGGSNTLSEFYKAQAVLARTFAIKNFTRHALEGFNLCDGTHCQAFNGKSRMNPLIYDAVLETANFILVDQDTSPIMTAYHANCGGITSSAAMAWNKDLPYLVSIHDPFCDNSPQHEWNKSLPDSVWYHYLEQKGIPAESAAALTLTNTGRQKFLDPDHRKLLLTNIREDLKLKSSFFTVTHQNGSVLIRGHGYGHGVGMCQEGAMEMARVGYPYVDILMFYFQQVKLERR